jgi:hypothetical protein
MTLRSIQFCLAAAGLALGAMVLAGTSAQAFTMENLSGNADGSSRYVDPDSQVKNGTMPLGQSGLSVQFGAQQPATPFSTFSHAPITGFGSSQPPPDPYNLNSRN